MIVEFNKRRFRCLAHIIKKYEDSYFKYFCAVYVPVQLFLLIRDVSYYLNVKKMYLDILKNCSFCTNLTEIKNVAIFIEM